MALQIRTTGLEQYAPGGSARLKMLVIGGPGAGKTRMASYWPKPFYLDLEGGLASVADRQVPFVSIKDSHDMLEALQFLKTECMKPDDQRGIQTVIIDTLDAFQRKVKDEWITKENKQAFTGYDAWNYLDSKMQMLMTRLLNLDLNVIVNVHYKDKVIKDDESGRESREVMLQLSGSSADTAFNDFDFVGWMGTYWEAVDGKRTEKRGLTFKRSPDKPFLKDRLYITPDWMEVVFADTDYTNLFTALTEKLSALAPGQEIGEVPTLVDPHSMPTGGVVSPSAVGGGALPPMDPREVPLAQLGKPELQERARSLGISFKSNHLKSELIKMIEDKLAEPVSDVAPTSEAVEAPAETPAVVEEPAVEAQPEPETKETQAVETVQGTEQVDPGTGEIVEPEVTDEAALENLQALGAEVISEQPVAEPVQVPETPAAATEPLGKCPGENCKGVGQANGCASCGKCGGTYKESHPDRVRLSFIKHRTHMCEPCYMAHKK